MKKTSTTKTAKAANRKATAAKEGVFAKNAAQYIDCFSTSSDYVISAEGDDLKITKKAG